MVELLRLGADIRRRYAGVPPPLIPGDEAPLRHPWFLAAGGTALHDAADGGFTATCAALLRHGAPAHASDADGLTPLERAVGRSVVDDPEDPWQVAAGRVGSRGRRWGLCEGGRGRAPRAVVCVCVRGVRAFDVWG